MKAMPIPALQDEGIIFLWVTGRAMEVGRECLREWGYTRVDEVVWVKTNQVSPIIAQPESLSLKRIVGSFNALFAQVGRDIGLTIPKSTCW